MLRFWRCTYEMSLIKYSFYVFMTMVHTLVLHSVKLFRFGHRNSRSISPLLFGKKQEALRGCCRGVLLRYYIRGLGRENFRIATPRFSVLKCQYSSLIPHMSSGASSY